ncbi:YdcF family protein [Rhizobium ruizarguesonis]|uniref:YdcF family protein n=1 Tax=Rhizobium ruizarguesonis TaxID=2081791 RepID=UPI00103230F7|nr:YdcF family protein [Rhizobium ruizarguesonis]TBB69487.1 YdcF family protein [Rhizobium ruizarguesonis]
MMHLAPRPFSAIVVLSNHMDEKGQINEETQERVRTGAAALKDGLAPVLVTCGWAYRDDVDISIAEAMARYATESLSIDSAKLITERSPRDTVGEAVFTKKNLARPLNWQSVLVATSAFHCPRALEIFSFVYGPTIQVEVLPAKSEMSAALEASEAKSLAAFRSTFDGVKPGDDDAIFERLRESHPFYNGVVYPRV